MNPSDTTAFPTVPPTGLTRTDPVSLVPPTHVEAKLSVSTAVTLAASVALALLNALQANSQLLVGLQPWAQFMLIAAIPPLISFVSGYLTTSNRV